MLPQELSPPLLVQNTISIVCSDQIFCVMGREGAIEVYFIRLGSVLFSFWGGDLAVSPSTITRSSGRACAEGMFPLLTHPVQSNWSVWFCSSLLKQRMMEVVVTAGAIGHAKLHQKTNFHFAAEKQMSQKCNIIFSQNWNNINETHFPPWSQKMKRKTSLMNDMLHCLLKFCTVIGKWH